MNDHSINKDFYDFHARPSKDKRDPKYGISVARKIVSQFYSSTNNYYLSRNERIRKNRSFARGFQDMSEFLSYMNVDAKQAFINLDMKPPAIAPKFMEVLISRFEERNERPTVVGIDKGSLTSRKQRRDDAEFRMNMGGLVNELQGAAGVPLEDPNAFTPETYDDLELHFETEDRTMQELMFEKKIKDTMDDNGYSTYKRSILTDIAESGLAVSYVYRDSNGQTKFFRVIPDDCFYGYSNFDDFRDCTVFGMVRKMKVSELREMYSGKISEKDLYEMYASTQQDGRVNINWTDQFIDSLIRPYDDAVIEVLVFEIVTNDKRMWVKKVDNDTNRLFVDERREAPQRLGENKQLISKDIRVVFKGCYCKNADKLIEWNLMENMIKPHYSLHEVFTNFVIHMPNNRDMSNMPVIERGETSIRMMSLIHLKIQQLIAKLRPDGLIINVSGLQDVDLGGGMLNPLQLQAIYDQTGNLYYNEEDEDGETNRQPPIRPAGTDGSVTKLQQLISSYNFYLQRLRDDIGTNEYVEGQGVSAKTGLGVLNSQVEASNRATEFIYRAYLTILEGVAKRIAVLEWYNIVNGKYSDEGMEPIDYVDFVPDLHIEMLPTDEEIAYLRALTEKATTAGLITFEEGFKVRRIAKRSVRLAEMYLAKYESRRLKQKQEQDTRNIEMNAQAQAASNKQTHQNKMELTGVEYTGKSAVQKLINEGDKIKTLGSMVTRILEASMTTGKDIPDYLKPLVAQYMQMMSGLTSVETIESQVDMQNIMAGIQAEQQAQEQQAQQEQA